MNTHIAIAPNLDLESAFTSFDRVYLSGPVTHFHGGKSSEENIAEFLHIQLIMVEACDEGLRVFNPAVNCQKLDYDEHMRRDITMLMGCTHILMLPGWQYSKGACTELLIACQLGMKVRFLIAGPERLVVTELLDSGNAKECARQVIAEILCHAL